jgi:hypothetical protein
MLIIVLPCEVFLLAPITAHSYGWAIAAITTATTVALTVLFVHLVLIRFHKIPFTCSTQRDVKQRLARILASIFAITVAVPVLAGIEHWMLLQPTRFIPGVVTLGIAWLGMCRYQRELLPQDRALTFEDRTPQAFELLKLTG